MTAVLIAITVIFHVGVPLALIAWLWFRYPTTRLDAVALGFVRHWNSAEPILPLDVCRAIR